jgi:hypothetical protein
LLYSLYKIDLSAFAESLIIYIFKYFTYRSETKIPPSGNP